MIAIFRATIIKYANVFDFYPKFVVRPTYLQVFKRFRLTLLNCVCNERVFQFQVCLIWNERFLGQHHREYTSLENAYFPGYPISS